MKRRLAALAAVAVVFAAAPVFDGLPVAPTNAAAKSCGGGYTHAVIRGAEKCLRRGQFCARAADRQYRRYEFRCTKRDATGRYHLT